MLFSPGSLPWFSIADHTPIFPIRGVNMNYSQQQNARRVRFLSQEIFDQWLADTYGYEVFDDLELNTPGFCRESFELLQSELISRLIFNTLTLDQLKAKIDPIITKWLAITYEVVTASKS